MHLLQHWLTNLSSGMQDRDGMQGLTAYRRIRGRRRADPRICLADSRAP